MAQDDTKVYGRENRKNSRPAVKVTKNNSGGRETSRHVQEGLKAKHGWDSKGQASRMKPSVPGYNYPSGTPKYIQSAANAAAKLTRVGALDCGYGKQEVHRSHRESLGGLGAPDVKKDQSYRNPVKATK